MTDSRIEGEQANACVADHFKNNLKLFIGL